MLNNSNNGSPRPTENLPKTTCRSRQGIEASDSAYSEDEEEEREINKYTQEVLLQDQVSLDEKSNGNILGGI